MRWLAAILAALLLPVQAMADDRLPALYRVTDVAADDVLNIREAPSASSAIIGALAPDARGVEVVARTESGAWGRVNTNEQSGWVAMRYMTRTPGPDWTTGRTPLFCFGTEPFWLLAIAPGERRVRLERPSEAPVDLPIRHLFTSVDGYPAALSAEFMNGRIAGVAQVKGGNCNDGMSDRDYGLEVDLLFHSAESPLSAVHGCCSLAR